MPACTWYDLRVQVLSPRTAQLGAVSAPVPAQRGNPRERGGEAGQRALAVVWDMFHPVKIESELDTEES